MICGLVLACAALAQADEGKRERCLARIPAGLQVAREFYRRHGRSGIGDRSTLAWSDDGRTVAYAARLDDGYAPVVGEEIGATFDWVEARRAAGGHDFFHVARRKGDEREQHWLWIDGKLIGPEDWMDELAVRADGKQVLVWTNPGFRPGGVANGKHQLLKATEKGSQWSLMRSDDSQPPAMDFT